MTSAPFNHESNGAAERMVRTFKTALLKIMDDSKQADDALAIFLSTYRSTPDGSGTSPAEKLHGRQPRTLLSAILPNVESTKKKANLSDTKFSNDQPVFARKYVRGKRWIAGKRLKSFGKRMNLVQTDNYGSLRRHQNQIRPHTAMKEVETPYFVEETVDLSQLRATQAEILSPFISPDVVGPAVATQTGDLNGSETSRSDLFPLKRRGNAAPCTSVQNAAKTLDRPVKLSVYLSTLIYV